MAQKHKALKTSAAVMPAWGCLENGAERWFGRRLGYTPPAHAPSCNQPHNYFALHKCWRIFARIDMQAERQVSLFVKPNEQRQRR